MHQRPSGPQSPKELISGPLLTCVPTVFTISLFYLWKKTHCTSLRVTHSLRREGDQLEEVSQHAVLCRDSCPLVTSAVAAINRAHSRNISRGHLHWRLTRGLSNSVPSSGISHDNGSHFHRRIKHTVCLQMPTDIPRDSHTGTI